MMYTQRQLIHGKDWKVMIVLDACRFDVFEDVIRGGDILGNYMKVDSQALHTAMWYDKNWNMDNDVNLISGHAILWLEDFSIYKRFKNPHGFFKDNRTNWIYPEVNLDKLIDYQKKYPGTRTLVHLIPPHLPFLGKKGKEFMKTLDLMNADNTAGVGNKTAYDRMTEYGVNHGWDEPMACYRENLMYVMGRIEKYIDRIEGSVVITGDHGELIGEDNKYGHNQGDESVLRSVPWFEVRR